MGPAHGRPRLRPGPVAPTAADDRRCGLQHESVQAAHLHGAGCCDRRKQRPQRPVRRPQYRDRSRERQSRGLPRRRRRSRPGLARTLVAMYDDPDVLAVGGRVEPQWAAGRPSYFAQELDWIVGCTYRGMPKVAAEVRNVIGANMSFRRRGPRPGRRIQPVTGPPGHVPLGCEETELCIRAVMGAPGLQGRLRARGPRQPPRSRRARHLAVHAGAVLVRGDLQGPGEPGGGPQTCPRPRTALRPPGAAEGSIRRDPRLDPGQRPGRSEPRGRRSSLYWRPLPPDTCAAAACPPGPRHRKPAAEPKDELWRDVQ